MEFLQNWMNELNMYVVVLLFMAGLLAIIKGGDWFVDSASWMAEETGIPKLIVGATIVSLGTTLPELLVSTIAAVNGEYDMAAGNAIGSVTANIALILSLSVIFMPAIINRKEYYIKSALMIAPLFLMFAFSFKGNINSFLPLAASIILIIIFIANIAENIFGAKNQIAAEKAKLMKNTSAEIIIRIKPSAKVIFKNVGFFLIGAFLIFTGAQLLQTSATTIAIDLGASKQLIGLTIVAIGTSLPELVTTITSIIKKESSLSVGNIIGANIIDITLILAVCGFICGGALPVSAQTVLLDIPVCLLVSLIAIVPALIRGKFERWQGFLNIFIYVCYVALLILGVGRIGIFTA